jgi:hypothetical protein
MGQGGITGCRDDSRRKKSFLSRHSFFAHGYVIGPTKNSAGATNLSHRSPLGRGTKPCHRK